MITCPYCDSLEVEPLGIDEGSDETRIYLCDIWQCYNCDREFEIDCIYIDEEESE